MPERKIQDYEWPPQISIENHIVGIISDGESFNFVLSDGQRSKLPIKNKTAEYTLDTSDEIYKVILRSRDSQLKCIEFFNKKGNCILTVGSKLFTERRVTAYLEPNERIIGLISRPEKPLDGKHYDF
jgi:hypothetical protein